MENEKIEESFQLALDATPLEREKSLELQVGYSSEEDTWQVVIRYEGEQSSFLEGFPELEITFLSGGYAILEIPESRVEEIAALPEVVYMEKPKRLFFAVNRGIAASCIQELQRDAGGTAGGMTSGITGLDGNGILVGCIDSGIDYAHPDFITEEGTSRIRFLWDQTIPGNPPQGFRQGSEYTREIINQALSQPTQTAREEICPSRDISGHGTHVAGIAAGNGRASQERYRGVAFQAELLIVKLGLQQENALPRTTELMMAVEYCVQKAVELGMPLALNLSFGNNYGSHSGTSLIETYLNQMAGQWKSVFAIGSGNEGASATHTSGQLRQNQGEVVELGITEFETALNLQIWKSYADEVVISIRHPNGQRIGPILQVQGPQRFTIENTQLLLYYGEPSPYSPYQEIYIDFLPGNEYLDAGIWEIELQPQRITQGNYDMWLPAGGVLNAGTGFLYPTEETTLTIPSTAAGGITVGAYDAIYDTIATFSGRGYTRETNQVKPDLVAPGVGIISCAPGGGYTARSGTSMATPFVTGAAALLMQWGIVEGNDSYLYGQKLKAYLWRGARKLPAAESYPNRLMGWGALCVRDSLPV